MPDPTPDPTSDPTSGPAPGLPDHEAALVAAAASGQLEPDEVAAYDALVAADPGVAAEVAELRALLTRVGEVGTWHDVEPSADLAARVLATPHAAVQERDKEPTRLDDHRPRRRRLLTGVAAAAALVVLGGVVGVAAQDWREQPPQGPPGTLGAVEQIDFRGEPADVDIEASLVAHTWGTETVLDMDGWTPGERFEVVLVGADGEAEGSGSFLGSQVTVVCRMNGALMREEVDVVEIRDARGRVVATSDVPAVGA